MGKISHDEITRRKIAILVDLIRDYEQKIESARLGIRHARDLCEHSDIKRWTNDDGDGQFIVERCNVCGLQRDGGLKR